MSELKKEVYFMGNMILQELRKKIIRTAMWTNQNASNADVNRNHTNYGATVAYANVLSDFGVNVDVPAYEVSGFLKIPKIVLNNEVIKFEEEY